MTATDPDIGQALSYSISGGVDAGRFTINSMTGALSFITAPNFEAPTDEGVANNTYFVFVQVSDGSGGVDTQSIAVLVNDQNEAPAFSTFKITRVSTAANGVQGNGDSSQASISADGRFVAFTSLASNLVPGDTKGDVFVRDLQTGAITRVSTGANDRALDPSISADGRFVAFTSYASNLVPGDTNGVRDVFVRDLQTGAITLVSTDVNGNLGNKDSFQGSISADGRFVTFTSEASNLAPGDTNGDMDVFVRDLETGAVFPVSTEGKDGGSLTPSISADGRYVVFSSAASNLVPGGTFGDTDVFVRDLQTGAIVRVSEAASFDPSISADGRYVAFASSAGVLVWDQQTGAITPVSTTANGDQGNGTSMQASISPDGRFVVFASRASNLVPGDTNGILDIFVRDLQTGAITRVSTAANGDQGNSESFDPSISADGRLVTFTSSASNLVPGDTNGVADVFVVPIGFSGYATLVAENNTAVMTMTATDPDAGQTLSYSISGGADAGKFTIGSTTGALSFITAPNFELPTDLGGNNVYDVIVQVSDGHGGIDTQAMAVTVQNALGVSIIGTAANDLIDATHTVAGQPLPTNEEDILDGGAGADAMFGGAGNDAYFVDNAGDTANESANQGSDTVYSTAHFRLSGDVEVLVLQGGADLQGFGNSLTNVIYGNSGSNVLDGDAGTDAMFGGAGNDAYYVDNAGDLVVENPNEGLDTVYSTAHLRLGANVETLVLQGSADLQGYGNSLSNSIYGTSGSNILDGDAGGARCSAGRATTPTPSTMPATCWSRIPTKASTRSFRRSASR